MTKSVLWHLLATFFGENKKKCETKVFVINFLCNTLQIPCIEYLEQKTMCTNMKKKNSSVPKNYGKTSKKTTPNCFGVKKRNQD